MATEAAWANLLSLHVNMSPPVTFSGEKVTFSVSVSLVSVSLPSPLSSRLY